MVEHRHENANVSGPCDNIDMRYSPLNPPPELLTALDSVVAGIAAVRAQMHSLQAAESFLLQTGDMLAQQMAAVGTGRQPTDSALNMAYRTVQTEIGTAVHESDRTVAVKMGRAADLVEKFPAVYRALARGAISGGHANAIVDAGEIVDDETARSAYEAAALDYAEAESVSRLRPVAKQLAEKYSGEPREERYERARAQRRVFVIEREDGMADLTAHLPAPYAYGIKDRLDQMARHDLDERRRIERAAAASSFGEADIEHQGSGRGREGVAAGPVDNRTADQLRADLLADMLLASDFGRLRTGGAPATNLKARVQVIVPIRRIEKSTSVVTGRLRTGDDLFGGLYADPGTESDGLGRDSAGVDGGAGVSGGAGADAIATLEGYGPISDEDATDIAAHADCWEQVTVDADTGTVLTVDTYRPSAQQRRFLGARDLHCRFPGCRAALAWCDVDHTIDAALGGPTSSDNLGHLCRRHHTLKHASPWTVAQDLNGVFTWVSPTGRTYVDVPESNVRFRVSDEVEVTAVPHDRPLSVRPRAHGAEGSGSDARTKAGSALVGKDRQGNDRVGSDRHGSEVGGGPSRPGMPEPVPESGFGAGLGPPRASASTSQHEATADDGPTTGDTDLPF